MDNPSTTLDLVARAICGSYMREMWPQMSCEEHQESVDNEWSDWLPEARAAMKVIQNAKA